MKIAPFLCLALLALAACSTTREFAEPAGEWQSWHGQLRYSGKDRPIIGEVVVRRAAPDHFQLEFLSGPGFPLLKLRSDGTHAEAEGVFARGRWSGPADRVPAHLRGWLDLPKTFSSATGTGIMLGPGWTERMEKRGDGTPKTLDVRIPETGERFQFNFGA